MADKQVSLSVVIRAVDRATAVVKGINDRFDKATKPVRDLGKQLDKLRENSGLDSVIGGFQGVGGAIADLGGKLLGVGAGIVGIGFALKGLIDKFDKTGDLADRFGVTVDFLSAMRYATERSGAAVEDFDAGLQTFSENLGGARANLGRMVKVLTVVAPTLLTQLKATKSTEQAFRILADAMEQVTDPAKRAKIALATVGSSSLAPLLARGSKGLAELQGKFIGFAGSQEEAAASAGDVDDSLRDLSAATLGIEAAIVAGLGPALKVLVDQLRVWLVDHREDVKRWAAEIGEKLPKAVNDVIDKVKEVVDWVTKFVDRIGGWKVAAVGVAAVIAGPLLSALTTLGVALLSTPFGAALTGVVALTAGIVILIGKINELWDSLDTSHETMLQDLVTLPPEEYRAKYKTKLKDLPALPDVGQIVAEQNKRPNLFSLSKNLAESHISRPPQFNATEFGVPQSAGRSEARIKVDFQNAPRGTSVTLDPKSSADVDLTVGHQLGGVGP